MVVTNANKCYVTCDEGRTYIDTTMGSGAQIIGHNNPLFKKISQQLHSGTIYTIPNCYTAEVNSYLKNYINPELHDEYIFCNSGTEANMRAIRLARAHTGKEIIGRFHGGWHGGLDGFLEEHPNNKGVPHCTNNLFKVLPYNDNECFTMITPDMAAVIVEVVQGSNPRDDIKPFLQKLRTHCIKMGVLLILDEVMTGFRLSKKGAAGVFGIKPDIVTYGKVLGGGFPIGAVGGLSEIMKTSGVFYGGTFSANPLSMYSAKLILESIINDKYINYEYLDSIGELFRNELNNFFIRYDKKMRVIGCGPLNRIVFTEKFIKNRKDRDLFETETAQLLFTNKLKEVGVFLNGNGLFHLSMCHTPTVMNEIISKIKKIS
tara:strand:- start:528 stop:1649 length:1122 start_codon:yes stop_codon:yes gene_type:complete